MGWLQWVLSLCTDKRELLDVTCFNHPVALQVSWDPLVRGGSNVCTHRAQIKQSLSGSQLVFKTTWAAYLFCSVFMAVGLILLLAFLTQLMAAPGVNAGMGLLGLVPCVFFIAGCLLLGWFRRRECCFETVSGRFMQASNVHDLRDVQAIQLIRETVRSGNSGSTYKSRYYSYELNLVLRDATRLNVTDHGSLRVIRADAELLAHYLSVPVWDAIDYRIPEAAMKRNLEAEGLGRNLFG